SDDRSQQLLSKSARRGAASTSPLARTPRRRQRRTTRAAVGSTARPTANRPVAPRADLQSVHRRLRHLRLACLCRAAQGSGLTWSEWPRTRPPQVRLCLTAIHLASHQRSIASATYEAYVQARWLALQTKRPPPYRSQAQPDLQI